MLASQFRKLTPQFLSEKEVSERFLFYVNTKGFFFLVHQWYDILFWVLEANPKVIIEDVHMIKRQENPFVAYHFLRIFLAQGIAV